MKKLHWSKLVDFITVVWLVLFVISFFANPSLESSLRTANIAILSVFVADLGIVYWKVRSPSVFVRKHWLDILMVIPYFRIFRIARILRLLRFVRITRGLKLTRLSKTFKVAKILKSSKVGKVSLTIHEIGDLLRTTKSRFIR